MKNFFFEEISNENKQEEVFFSFGWRRRIFFCQSWMSRDRNYLKKEIENRKIQRERKKWMWRRNAIKEIWDKGK